jgi:thioesterase domain-containing protein/acyl carrier protein
MDQTGTADLAAMLAAKAAGAAWLDELTRGQDLDAFVLFSSIAATWGSAGQSGYAAANAYLDALARQRAARGQAAASIAWGSWDGGGISSGDGSAGTQRPGVRLMDPARAISALAHALDTGQAQLTIADIDWERFTPLFTLRRPSPLLTSLPDATQALAQAGAAQAGTPQGAAQGPALRDRLAQASKAEQELALSDLVRGEIAAVLGYESSEAVEAESGFLELGFDSLTIVQFRNRLNAVTGMELPASAISECPTPAALARRLRTELAASDLPLEQGSDRHPDDSSHEMHRYLASADAKLSRDAASPDTAMPGHSLSGLYVRAAREGKAEEIMTLVKGLAAFRPTFSDRSGLSSIPRPVRLAQGPEIPGLICFSSFFGKSGAQEYARLAGRFRGVREVSAITAPGFAAGEPLPASADALIGVHGENIRESVNGAPFVIAGHSSGAVVAHAVATYLESIGTPPAAIVLLDAYAPGRDEFSLKYASHLLGGVLADTGYSGQWSDDGDDSWLTAMAHYFSLDWSGLDKTSTPTLLVRATEMPPALEGKELSWEFSSDLTTLDVPGNHFTMLTDHADTTAHAVKQWLAELEGSFEDGNRAPIRGV